jgi:hypothetical protein
MSEFDKFNVDELTVVVSKNGIAIEADEKEALSKIQSIDNSVIEEIKSTPLPFEYSIMTYIDEWRKRTGSNAMDI